MNNPYAPKLVAKKAPVPTREALPRRPPTAGPRRPPNAGLFAAEAYHEEPVAPRRDPKEDAAKMEIARLRNELRGETRALRAAVNRPQKVEENHDLNAQLASLRSALAELVAGQVQQNVGDAVASAVAAIGVEGPAAAAIARDANAKKTGYHGVRDAVAAMIDTMPAPWELAEDGKILVGLVGPAGVGKTTTAAKLAARAIMAHKTVALVSCDAFRVGAIDQLGKYADLMDAKFHTALNQEELYDIIASETADVVIVDTVGRPIDSVATEALLGDESVRVSGRRVEVLLCVPSAIRAGDMTRVASDYALVQPTGIILTKLDETAMPAGIIHASYTMKLPLSAVCCGQRVPEDIMAANTSVLVDALIPNKVDDSK